MYALNDEERQSNQLELRRQPGADVNIPVSFDHAAGAVSVLNFRHPSNVVASFNHIQLFALGVARLFIGLLCIVFNIVNICFIDQVGWVVYVTGNGFWAGCMVGGQPFSCFTISSRS